MKKQVQMAINYAKSISAEAISKAKSGHTGSAVGASTILFSLFKDHYFFDPDDSNFLNRDRFVMSAGHACPLLYTLMYMFKMGVTEDDLKSLRRIGSNTPGHPEYKSLPFVEVSTGPLGQGVANAVGMAIAEASVEEKFNAQKFAITNNYTYCYVGDGCLMEGVANEAISLAGTLSLNRLIVLYDSNNITIDGKATIANRENVAAKFKAMNWDVIKVHNGHNYGSVTRAIGKAKKNKKPTIIIFKTKIGVDTPYENTPKIHGMFLSPLEIEQYKIKLGVQGSFHIPQEVENICKNTIRRNLIKKDRWTRNFVMYQTTHPELYKKFISYWEDKPIDFEKMQKYVAEDSISGREANRTLLNLFAAKLPRFMGGSADVAASSYATIAEEYGVFSKKNRRGRGINFGIREHGMAAICNGITLYNNSPSFCSTYLTFSNYLLPAMRMSAQMKLPVWYAFSHESFRRSEDGPTHQPVEQLGTLRLMPNLNVFRPADMTELLACYKIALNNKLPSAFLLSRQILSNQKNSFEKAQKGGYVLSNSENPDISIYATGSEVEMAVQIKENLEAEHIAVKIYSFPCIEEFEKQSETYKKNILNDSSKLKVVLEAANDNIWYKLLGNEILNINITEFGKSGRTDELEKYYGYTVPIIYKKIKNIFLKHKNNV